MALWIDEVKPGTRLRCSDCGKVFKIGMAVFDDEAGDAAPAK